MIKSHFLSYFGILLTTLAPVFIFYCTNVPLLLIVGIGCTANFLSGALMWAIRGESIASKLKSCWKALPVVMVTFGSFRWLFWGSVLTINPAQATALSFSWPVMVTGVEILTRRYRAQSKHLAGLSVAAVATVLMMGAVCGGLAAVQAGHIGAFAAGLIWAVYAVLASRYRQLGGDAVVFGMLGVGIMATGASVAVDGVYLPSLAEWMLLIAAGVIAAVGVSVWLRGQVLRTDGGDTSAWLASPLIAVLVMVIFTPSELSFELACGVVLVVCAGVLMLRSEDDETDGNHIEANGNVVPRPKRPED